MDMLSIFKMVRTNDDKSFSYKVPLDLMNRYIREWEESEKDGYRCVNPGTIPYPLYLESVIWFFSVYYARERQI